MFGRRKREEAAAEAAREDERRSLFAKLAERPEHICPFLGLEADRTGYVDGVSSEHRCFAFGDPAPLSAEQQTRVCQERGYGNCPRYLRGVLVIPTEELEALRRPRAAAPPPPATPAPEERRSRAPLVAVLALLLLVGVGAGAYVLLGGLGSGVAVEPTPTAEPSPSLEPTPTPTATTEPTPEPSPTVPLNAITRGELARLMADALELPPATADYYIDDTGSDYEGDINRLAEAGVTIGCTDIEFCPDAFATRAELASFVARALQLPPATQDYFTDDDGSPHEPDINRLAEAGYTDGCAPGLYCPDDTVTRVEEELSQITGAQAAP